MVSIECIAPENVAFDETMSAKEAREALASTVRRAKELKIPTVILFEGWGASGKGYMIEKLISELDPRGFKVYSIGGATADERRYPMLRRFWTKLPSYGNISIFDRSWYREVSISRVEDGLPHKTVELYYDEIREFERQLADDGYIIIKFFLNISKEEQRERFEALESSAATKWRVTDDDHRRHKNYAKYYEAFAEMIDRTNRIFAPWHVLDASDKKLTARTVVEIVNRTLTAAIDEKLAKKGDEDWSRKDDAIDYELAERTHANPIPADVRVDMAIDPLPIPPLDSYDLSRIVTDEEYKVRLKELQNELFKLHNKLYMKKRPLIIVFEGWDAAGKGGSIKRLTSGLDPRGFEVIPVAAPTPTELSYQYLWRFWNTIPKTGHIGIYDRSWYGRVMVERLEGFAKRREWVRAFDEMNHFERSLVRSGAIVVKFWLHIDDDEQLRRFTERQNTPEKQWKITDEDWRNRDKRLGYHISVDQMLSLTNTPYAPWYVVESNNKKYARLKVLECIISEIKKNL
ncbi:MAG: phosphate--AMP phosphotransferase [Clostridia bacterium]|nr:phosphate--AMP phosphotransferase [Clostridia bacterium]